MLLAVGDSCLFVVRGDRLCLSLPLDEASQFDNNPALSLQQPRKRRGPVARTCVGAVASALRETSLS